MGKKGGKKVSAIATKIISFTEHRKKKTSKHTQKNKPVRFSEMSEKDRKDSIEASRED
jgi:hypothetical protein